MGSGKGTNSYPTEAEATQAMNRQDVVDLMHDMPDKVDIEELMYRLYLKEKLERAEAALAADDVLTEEEVDRLSEEWLA